MPISNYIEEAERDSSWIRRMFDLGRQLSEEHGAGKVADFSLGNPNMVPPKAFIDALKSHAGDKNVHRYMPNAGFPDVREKISAWLEKSYGVPFTQKHVVMTTGAAGAMNTVLKTVLNAGEEVVCFEPFFCEYKFYIENHGGKMVLAKTERNFDIDFDSLNEKINSRTRAVIINSPNNPTGKIYGKKQLKRLAGFLEEKQEELCRPIYVLSDEPYREIVFDGNAESIVPFYPNSFMVYSWSKSLNIPGDRIGYIAANPGLDDSRIFEKLAFSNRILGFVNAPSFIQSAVADVLDEKVDAGVYKKKRDKIASSLRESGYDFTLPEGAFYFFPESPLENDLDFVERAAKELVLVTPGTGFGRPGYFRISYAVDDSAIERGLNGLARVMGGLN